MTDGTRPRPTGATTQNQRVLSTYEDRFRRSSPRAAEFLAFLRRSEFGVWRFEPDSAPSRWWINVTMPAHQQELFGLDREIQVLYTEYEHVEPRSLSLVQNRVRRDMRVEPDVAILVSRDVNIKHAAARRAGELAIVTVNLDEVQVGGSAPLHQLIAESVATVDHYDVSTPVRDPSGFYGRNTEIESIASDLRRGISVGLFGLRKAGKTSLLNSFATLRSEDPRNLTVRVDVSEVATGEQFRSLVLEELWSKVQPQSINPVSRLRLQSLSAKGERRVDRPESSTMWIKDLRTMLEYAGSPVVLIVDEIDQAFPDRSNLGEVEARELYNSLIQLRSLLQEQDRLVMLCAGVDPSLFERPIFNGRDNLLYKLVKLAWLAPLTREEMAEMVRSLGKRMGVRVRDHRVIDALYESYGGHPLLTRKACSISSRDRRANTLPFHMTLASIEAAMASREYGGPADEAEDVISSFSEWFAAESALLRLKFSDEAEERELAEVLLSDEPNGLRHAVAYGVCFADYSPRIYAAIQALDHRATSYD